MKTIKQLKLTGKRVFIRCDFNVPLKNGKVTDNYRLLNALLTIKYVLKQKPQQIILASHLGRPDSKSRTNLAEFSLAPVAKELSKLLKRTIELHPIIDAPTNPKQKIVLLENLRFYDGEKKGDIKFAKQLAKHADVYIDDAFGTMHRKDASVYALPKLLPHAAGLLVEQEIKNVHLNHKKPLVAIFGAAKISDKLPLFKKLLAKVDKLILGGGVVFTFMRAADIAVGHSLVEEDMIPEAKKLLKKYGAKIIFPTDFAVATPAHFKGKTKIDKKQITIVDFAEIPKTKAAYDVGSKSVKLFSAVLGSAKTVVWNGPLGVFEVKPFDKGTNTIIKFLAEHNMTTIIGGGDTASAVHKTNYAEKMTHISTGGGASLELLAGNKLPAIEVLK
ncbi:phosphoglycerate kinase [Candidatus Woesearchaeota archaeon]|nr:phosphoglycerate kinase [Candidatus Woesearchaeota archaeon]